MGSTLQACSADLDALAASVLAAIPGAQAVYLFGSAAGGRLRAESDVDLAVLAESKISADVLFAAAAMGARQLGRDVDLVDLRAVPLVLQAQVIGCGRRLADGGHASDTAFFENGVLSRYVSFVEERRPLIEAVVRRRSIHAA